MSGFLYRVRLLAMVSTVAWLRADAARGLDFREIDAFAAPTNATMMAFSPQAGVLVLKNSESAVAVIEIETRQSSLRLAQTGFTDIALSPSGRYIFAADPGATSYIHRLDLSDMTWDVRTGSYMAQVQAVSDTQILLSTASQWVTFANDEWGSLSTLIPLCPPYYAVVYAGDFRYDVRTGRLLHGNSGSSSQEIQAFKIVDNNFVRQEGSGIYGTAQGYGGTVVLATDGSAFYYGSLQVDPLDVSHNTRVFPEKIYAANGRIALGDRNVYHARTGALLGALPFRTTVYAMNPEGEDFWAYDALTTTLHRFLPAASFYTVTPCRLVDTRDAPGPFSGPALSGGASRTFVLAGRCDVPAPAITLAANITVTNPAAPGYLTVYPADAARPLASNVNYAAGMTRGNNAQLKLGPGGDVIVYCEQGSGTVDVIIDVTGYYQ